MNKAGVLALVGVLAVVATGLASGGLDARGAYRELAQAVPPTQDPAPPAEGSDSDKDQTPCGAATGADDRSRDVDDDEDADCDGEVAGENEGDTGDNNGGGDEEDAEVKKVTICHYEGNGSWHTITPSVSAIVMSGHDGHPNDIIPPFSYTDKKEPKEYRGKNWSAEGRAIFDNDCVEPKPPPTPEPTPDTVWPVGNFVKCVDNFGDGTFVAWFGYDSSNKAEVTIPIGELNKVTPGENRGQPSKFQPGNVESAFSATGWTGETISWRLTSPPVSRGAGPWTSEAEAGADFETKCSSPPEPPAATVDVFVTCVENNGDTYGARFGYVNPSQASVSLAIGAQNRFTPGKEFRDQPEQFTPGRVDVAVVVGGIPNSVELTWRVDTGNGAPSTATARDTLETKCSDEPPPPPPPDPEPPPPDPEPGPPPPPEDRGPVGIFVQCITTRGATYDAVFGYQNDNAYAVDIPVGSDNRFVPGGDRGQTTTFLPGNHQDAFTVAGIPSRQRVTWAVTYGGATRFARPDSEFTQCAAEPPELQPIGLFACIVDRGDSFDAVFGYENDNPVDITVPIGQQNFVIPRPVNRQQPTVLSPGRHENAFTVRSVDSAILAWTVKHEGVRTVIVTSEYPVKCAGSPPTTLPLKVFPLCVRRTGSTYMARFGYINPNHGDVVVPIGASNFVGPQPQDRGQPTTLRPGIAWSAFTVRRIPLQGSVTWTVKYAGETARANATADLRRNCLFNEEGPDAQLEIDKSVEPDATVVGDRVTFRIVVRNEGTTTAQNATVIDRALDDRIVQLSAKPSQGRCVLRPSRRVICRLGPLDPGEAATITVLARARASGESRNRAVVLSLPEDFGADNVDRVTMLVSPAHSVAKPSFTG